MAVTIKNIDDLSADAIRAEVANGGRFLQFDYAISIVVMTFKRSTDIYFVRHDESHWKNSWPFTLCSLLIGWWGIPWGFIYTPMALYTNLGGGRDLTREVMMLYRDNSVSAQELSGMDKERW
jgi:hypothetical protein